MTEKDASALFASSELVERAQNDVKIALMVWKDLLPKIFGKDLLLAYYKGSALKMGSGHAIDYVPQLSDLDIHIRLTADLSDERGKFKLFRANSITEAMENIAKTTDYMREFESIFMRINPSYLHVPRAQFVILNNIEKEPSYVHPFVEEVGMLYGDYLACYPERERERNEERREEGTKEDIPKESGIRKTDEEIRAIDKNTLLMDHATLNSLADTLFGKTEKDLWYVIRSTLCWKVSHTPIRLLTQLKRDIPARVLWGYNRTQVLAELQHVDPKLAVFYREFYEWGWRVFLTQQQDQEMLREMILAGSRLMAGCCGHASLTAKH